MADSIFLEFLQKKSIEIDARVKADRMKCTHKDIDTYLYNPLSKFCENGGKRHRPIICELACEASGGNPKAAHGAGLAIEYFHLAALIHDDIADESTTRHGQPCMHINEGLGLSINAGDFALTHMTGLVLEDDLLEEHTKLRVLHELNSMAYRTIEGQALDLGWVRDARFDVSTDDYECMANHKTAYYSCAVPLVVGAICGGATDEQIEIMRHFGMSCGLAFQLQDDLLNLVGDAKEQGKDFRSDITESKRTLAVVYALQHLNRSQHDELIEILNSKSKDGATLNRAVQIMEDSGALKFVKARAVELSHAHRNDVLSAFSPSFARDCLLDMADFFVSRLK